MKLSVKSLTLSGRIIILVISLMIPVLILVGLLVNEKNIAITFAQKEMYGNDALIILKDIYKTSLSSGVINNGTEQIENLEKYLNTIGSSSKYNINVLTEISELKKTLTDESISSGIRFEKGGLLWSRIGDRSNLILDPDLDSYYLMDIVVLKIPEIVGRIYELNLLNRKARSSDVNYYKTDFIVLSGLIRSSVSGFTNSATVAGENDSTSEGIISSGVIPVSVKAADAVIRFIEDSSFLYNEKTLDRLSGTPDHSQALSEVYSLFDVSALTLGELLNKRISAFRIKMYISLALVFLSVLICLFIAVRIIRHIKKTLSGGIELIERMSDGDLTEKEVKMTNDEIGELVKNIVLFNRKVSELISDTKMMSGSVGEASDRLNTAADIFSQNAHEQAAATEEISATLEEFLANMESISDGTSELNESFVLMNTKMTGLSGFVNTMMGNIDMTFSLTEKIKQTGNDQKNRVDDMTVRMQRISDKAIEMNSILEIITDISDKINLLSLNASIEAARAGDSGRGFAVVADEISKLADLTSTSIKDIATLIGTSANETVEGLGDVKAAIATMNEILSGISDLRQMLEEINQYMQKQMEINNSVNIAADLIMNKFEIARNTVHEQREATQSVTEAVSDISRNTQNTAKNASELHDMAGSLNGLVLQLRKSVEYFRC
jgi:methyl-accepting chemotaxis protein